MSYSRITIKLLLCLFGLLFPSTFFAENRMQDLRKSVAIVEPSFSQEQLDNFEQYSLYLSRVSLRYESRYLSSLRHGISGSGIVLRFSQPSGRDTVFLVTNGHVVSFADSVKLTFQIENKKTVYRNCRVLSVSPFADLALVELPESAKISALFPDTIAIYDGLDILTAGYPGLDGNPSWQLTKGSISNSNLRNESLLGKNSAVYQHTAPIDGGSSGGPLLVATDYSYRVIGINTWKASYREGVGIAIPSAQIIRFVEEYLESDKPTNDNQKLTEEWNQLLRQDYVAASEKISFDCISEFSAEEWYNMIYNAGRTVQKSVLDYEGDDPLGAVRQVVSFQLQRYLNATNADAQIDAQWSEKQGTMMIDGVKIPTLSKKQYKQATKYLKNSSRANRNDNKH